MYHSNKYTFDITSCQKNRKLHTVYIKQWTYNGLMSAPSVVSCKKKQHFKSGVYWGLLLRVKDKKGFVLKGLRRDLVKRQDFNTD